MKQVISSVNGWVNEITEFLQGLIVLGVVVGILFNDYFGVIGGIGKLMGHHGDNGRAWLVALLLVVLWYKK